MVDRLAAQARSTGIEILETSCRAGIGAEDVYSRLGFTEYGRLPWGLLEAPGEELVCDEVYFHRALD